MAVTELRCPSCLAPIDPSYGSVQRCPYCGTSLSVTAAKVEGKSGGVSFSAPAHPPPASRVFLQESGPNKIAVIKVIREHTGLGLKEAKDLCESAPCVVAQWDDQERMRRFREALVQAGAKVN